ncbi:hypothetical protein [Scytonema sp. HK-05]|nr:hypothetical protein [Scytonema sp. HK-05]
MRSSLARRRFQRRCTGFAVQFQAPLGTRAGRAPRSLQSIR